MYVCMCMYDGVYVCMCMYMYGGVYVCMYVYVYVWRRVCMYVCVHVQLCKTVYKELCRWRTTLVNSSSSSMYVFVHRNNERGRRGL